MAATRNKPSVDLLPGRVGDFLAPRLVPAERICLGLSGGCDSVVLLHVLRQLGLGERLTAVHVHHGLSPNADAWADFCGDYCATLGIALRVVRVAVDRQSGLGLEAAARAARYAALADSAAEVVMLAQHRGDQAETLLFNLLRGTGVAGAAGIPAERRCGRQRLLRPLLGSARPELEAYARQHALRWIEDESNADPHYSRNFLRHQVLPVLRQRFPAAESSLAQAAQHFAEADGLLAELALADWQTVGADASGAPVVRLLCALSLPRLKNLLRYRLRQLGWRAPAAGRLDEFARQLLTAGADRHPRLDLPDGCLCVAARRLHWLIRK
ncbi:MAG: PP-loop [Proteobacteria bacterium]|nr:PP-loop [Pseudomonadota bacterium]